MALILYCGKCLEGYRFPENTFKLPSVCPMCSQDTEWTAATITDDPKVPYDLTGNDKRFLRSLRIEA